MIAFIENLRNKPESTRRTILFSSLAIVMVVIVSIWVMTIKYTLDFSRVSSATSNAASPFFIVREGGREFFGVLSREFVEIKGRFSDF